MPLPDGRAKCRSFHGTTARRRYRDNGTAICFPEVLILSDLVSAVPLAELDEAAALIHAVMPPTPQFAWPKLQQRTGCKVWVKHENHTPTGAFKVRGGLVYLDRLLRRQPAVAGLVSAT